jgi:hypothetical protein
MSWQERSLGGRGAQSNPEAGRSRAATRTTRVPEVSPATTRYPTTSPAPSNACGSASRGRRTALAAFFGVPCGYFFDDAPASPTSEDPAVLLALRDDAGRRSGGRLAGLSPATVDALVGIVERMRTLEGLTAPGASVEEPTAPPGVDGQLAPRPHAVDGVATGPDGLGLAVPTPRTSPAIPSQSRRGPGRQAR